MRRNKSVIAGLICGLCCMVCVGLYVAHVEEQAGAARAETLARYGGEQIEVCVARRDVVAGEVLDESSVETKMWVAALLPEGALTSRAEALGKQVGSSILKGEVISSKRFEATAASIDVPDGLTAVSVPAREVQAVGGALASGMKADVYAVGSTSTTKLVSGALIVATSASSSGLSASSSVSWVTLAVSPSAVEELVTAAQSMDLYFVLPTTTEGKDA
ncbi:MAG: SAF domain-containing protein [Eggerthellaceae bacterium]|nr:SAF domain-containing protein [Eggerthellaceae bacterium]